MSDLAKTYVVIGPDFTATSIDVGRTIWQDLDRRFGSCKGHLLVAKFDFDSDWPSWEIHPAGDEIVVLLSGRAEIIFDQAREPSNKIFSAVRLLCHCAQGDLAYRADLRPHLDDVRYARRGNREQAEIGL